MLLSDLLTSAGYPQPLAGDPDIVDVTEDSRHIEPGRLFVAVPGTRQDGRRFIHDAQVRGAAAVVSQRPVDVGIPSAVVPDARAALGDLAAAVHGFPCSRLDAFAVTGTDGKTTTCFLLRSILDQHSISTGLISTVEIVIGGRSIGSPGRLTTPSASFVQRALRRMVDGGDTCAVVECSSHALTQDRLRNISLRAAAITNVAADHLEFHGSAEAYAQAKARIASLIEPQKAGSMLLNADDSTSMWLASAMTVTPLTYGMSPEARLRARDVKPGLERTDFVVEWESQSIRASIPMGGIYNVYNSLAAAGMAMAYGIPLEESLQALSTTRTPPGRLQPIDSGQPFSVFVDYAHTEQAFQSVLSFLAPRAHERGGHLIAVFGAAGDRDHAKRRQLAQTAGRLADYFVITNEDPFGEDPDAILAEIAAGAPPDTRYRQWTLERDRRQALENALERARPDDIVIITGKGHEGSIDTAGSSMPWNDADVVRDILTRLPERIGAG
jgi:UDP-N-acetylmuramoyl-L-alanyl-D-glutamate--2,6-diaminopimelate ligase